MENINWNQMNGTQYVRCQFKMAAKYSKWPPKFNFFNKMKEVFLKDQSMFMSSN